MTMSNTKKAKIGKSKATFIPKDYEWGLYFWRLPSGHLFHDDDGNLLNIPAMKHDLSKIAELRKAAAHYGQPEGEPWFYPGIRRATDEQLSEQKDRLKAGLIPNLDDLGAVHAAQQTLQKYGKE
jgi:hypothetical protein